MSLFSALNTAVSGLSSQEWAIGNISNNIANSQTVGYKEVNTSFESLVYGNGLFQQPESVEAQSVYTNNVSGSIIQSQQATSLAINGAGFFDVLGPPTSTTNGVSTFNAENFYSRRGDFQVNQYGYLVNGAGYTLQGYPVSATTGQASGTTVGPIQIPNTEGTPVATKNVSVTGSLPSGQTTAPTNNQVTEEIYDAQGNAHKVTITFTPVTTTATPPAATNEWQATITAQGDTSDTGNGGIPSSTVLDLTYGSNGTLSTIAQDTASTGVPVTTTTTGTASATIPWVFGGVAQSLNINFGTFGSGSGLTNYGSSTVGGTPTISATATQDGYPPGTLSGLSVDDNGFVNLTYSNGQVLKAAQVAIVQFNAPDQLQSIDGSTFIQTADSGAPNVTTPGVNGAGTISPSALEQSNVDLATELTQLITAQQAYSSNAKVITTANQMLQTVTNLIQG